MKYITLSFILVLAACSSTPKESTDNKTTPEPEQKTEVVVETADVCTDFGPQTPRDIAAVEGTNAVTFTVAPAYTEMNLCNIHTHTQAEHKGPGFSIEAPGEGFQCNGTPELTAAELAAAPGAYEGVKPGDTIEVHWVHSSCDVKPGEGLGACLTDTCKDPLLRVETQVFLVVNDKNALDFTSFDYTGAAKDGKHQAKAIPADTGTPVQFLGSTTGPKYTEQVCSPAQVTWSVRPNCAKVDINSLHRWAEKNAFAEKKSHGVRELVKDTRLLSPIN